MKKIIMLILCSISLSGCGEVGYTAATIAYLPVVVTLAPLWGLADYTAAKDFNGVPEPRRVNNSLEKGNGLGELGKVMLECGYTDIYGSRMTENETIESDFCVERASFKLGNVSAKEICRKSVEKDYPACRSGAVIPQRSVARRLNSAYCKSSVHKHSPECQP